jgi:hypothetical protein
MGFPDLHVEHRVLLVPRVCAKGIEMKPDGALDVGPRGLGCVTFADDDAAQADRILDMAVRMPFDDDRDSPSHPPRPA